MKIKVIGKNHRKGISNKNGKPYDFIEVRYNGPARGVEGLGAQTLGLDPQTYPYDSITVGGDYMVDFDNKGGVSSGFLSRCQGLINPARVRSRTCLIQIVSK